MTVLMKVIAFLLAVGPLIILHELGHYLVARACGVKVVRFSFFMGKVLWSRRFGRDQTEWAISAIPLGGYVKFLDDRDPATRALTEEDKRREYTRQNVWKRIAIVAAGPAANFLVAILLFAGLFMSGVPEPTTRLRPMAEASAAWHAGLRGGETVVAVNGQPVETWSQIRMELTRAVLDETEATLDVREQDGGSVRVLLPAASLAGADIDSDILGKLGLMPDPGPGQVRKVLPDGAAARAGLQSGDLITAIDGKATPDGIAVIEAIRASKGQPIAVTLRRAEAVLTVTVTPELDPKDKIARIKAEVGSNLETKIVSAGPFEAIVKGADATWNQMTLMAKSIGGMFTGQVSLKNLSGPGTIADYAEQSARQGLIVFLSFVAAISIGMGVMNLLPIPVLDGGLLLYYSLEVLTGRALPEKADQYVRQVGIVLFVLLMSLALYNDAVRLLG